jgi:hypothetical protein
MVKRNSRSHKKCHRTRQANLLQGSLTAPSSGGPTVAGLRNSEVPVQIPPTVSHFEAPGFGRFGGMAAYNVIRGAIGGKVLAVSYSVTANP